MNAYGFGRADDPRSAMTSDELAEASVRAAPQVTRRSGGTEAVGLAAGVLGVAVLGGLTLVGMSNARTAKPAPSADAASAPATASLQPLPPAGITPAPAALAPVVPAAAPLPAMPSAPIVTAATPTASPVLILDNTAPTPAPLTAAGAPAPAGSAVKTETYFTPEEQFAGRAAGEGVPTSRASRLSNPGLVVAQGTVIAAVLETALNSDLPGYARALVSQDVRSFDGRNVLIPRGSRLVGSYKSGLQTGQSRAFIIWTRVLRPDGVSVQLASPATDDLGQAGLSGRVDRHFLQRFGSAILLSIVGGLANAAASNNNGAVIVGATGEGTSAAATALKSTAAIPPTVRVPQGTPIQVFTARDLDFSGPR